MRRHRIISSFLEYQNNSFELLLTAVLVAIGVNVFSTGIVELLDFPHKEIVFIIIGATISIGVILRILSLKLKKLNQTTVINGFVIYDEEKKTIVNIPKYDIAEDMVRYLNAAFFENKALEQLWKQDHIGRFRIVGGKQGERAVAISTHSAAIFIELLEYCVIEKLSVHLSDYFNNHYEKPKIRAFGRADIPEILLQNRFLKLFSEDMNNRAAFTCAESQLNGENRKTSVGEIVSAYSSGALYSKFDLVLPEKSKVARKNKNEVVIETPILKITISCLYGGFSAVLRSGFSKYYLGINNSKRNFQEYQFNVEVAVKFKIKSLFSKEKETYYAWIDSFLDTLSDYIGEEDFFERINWDTVYTMICCRNNLDNSSTSRKGAEAEHVVSPISTQ